jgi:hypothetical protein
LFTARNGDGGGYLGRHCRGYKLVQHDRYGIYHLSAAELAGLAQFVNDGGALIDDPVIDDDYHYNFRGVTITLGGDIDLGGHEWTPIGYFDPTGIGGWQLFAGTFDGGGHPISGLAIGTASSPETSLYMQVFCRDVYGLLPRKPERGVNRYLFAL